MTSKKFLLAECFLIFCISYLAFGNYKFDLLTKEGFLKTYPYLARRIMRQENILVFPELPDWSWKKYNKKSFVFGPDGEVLVVHHDNFRPAGNFSEDVRWAIVNYEKNISEKTREKREQNRKNLQQKTSELPRAINEINKVRRDIDRLIEEQNLIKTTK